MSAPKQLLVKGHTLPYEGAFWFTSTEEKFRRGRGPGQCSCGVESEQRDLSLTVRKRWHRQHKLDVLAAPVEADAKGEQHGN